MRFSIRSLFLFVIFVTGLALYLFRGLPSGEQVALSEDVVHELLGVEETCVQCHGKLEGFAPSHDPKLIGCTPCHGGDPFAANAEQAHQEMILVPGNLADVRQTCGAVNCHLNITERVEYSLMTTMSGVVGVDRFVFGERPTAEGFHHIMEIGDTPADTHLRQLCASCHLGNSKVAVGPITELSRGGGCNACHLNYTEQALTDLRVYRADPTRLPSVHPTLNLQVTNDHCFGCHSRSSRISLNYEGWHETLLETHEIDPADPHYRLLQDGRVATFVQSDVHHQAGLACIDCHHVQEVMGDGQRYTHKAEALKVGCADCHQSTFTRTLNYADLDTESKQLLAHRGISGEGKQFLQTATQLPLINAWIDSLGQAQLQGKNSGRKHPLPAPADICSRQGGHAQLSCNACHTGWAPQCIGCHNTFEPSTTGFDLLDNKPVSGKWVEHIGVFFHDRPSLGIVQSTGIDAALAEEIKTFIPGMTLTIDSDSFQQENGPTRFHRLYAPTSAHTTQRVGRSCASCHQNPLALGYGRGQLEYRIEEGRGRWIFTPEYANDPQDGLPQDAWIGFLQEPQQSTTARTTTRPFSLATQQRILTVGACLSCHEPKAPIMLEGITDFQAVMNRRTKACVAPVWE